MSVTQIKDLSAAIAGFSRKLKPAVGPILAVFAAAALLTGSYCRTFDVYEYQTYDWRFRIKPAPPISDQIVIIEIGDDTLKYLGWPFDRMYYAALIEALRAAGARMLGVDVLFVEKKEPDAQVGQAAAAAGNVFFAEVMSDPKSFGGELVSHKMLESLVPEIAAGGRGVGFVNLPADADGTRRRMPPIIRMNDQNRFHLSILMAADYLGVPFSDIRREGRHVRLGNNLSLPVDDDGYFLIHYAGRWEDTFIHMSFLDIVRAHMQEEAGEKPVIDLNVLKGKVCFLGHTATGTHDEHPIPLQPIFAGIGIYPNIFNSILQRQFLVRVSPTWNGLVLILLAAAAFFLARIPKLMVSASAALAVMAVFWAAGVALFVWVFLWIDLFYPSVVFGLIYLGATLYRTMGEKRKRELIEAELTIASNIQKSFLPSSLPDTPRFDVSVYMKPAKHVGGDLYSIFKTESGDLGVMLGDVSGKGTPAALFMAKSVSEFKFNSRGSQNPAEVLAKMNDSLAGDESSGLFVTVSYAIFIDSAATMSFSNGGHLPVLRVRDDGSSDQLMPGGGMPIALMPGIEFENFQTPIRLGDIFIFYSDGISEAKNTKRDDYEMDRFTECVKKSRAKTSLEIQKDVLEDIRRWVGHAPQHDDMTLIIVKVR